MARKRKKSGGSKGSSQAEFLKGGIVHRTLGQLVAQMTAPHKSGGQSLLPVGFRIGFPTLPGDWILCKTLWGGYTCTVYKTDGSKSHDSSQPSGKCAYTWAGEAFDCVPKSPLA